MHAAARRALRTFTYTLVVAFSLVVLLLCCAVVPTFRRLINTCILTRSVAVQGKLLATSVMNQDFGVARFYRPLCKCSRGARSVGEHARRVQQLLAVRSAWAADHPGGAKRQFHAHA